MTNIEKNNKERSRKTIYFFMTLSLILLFLLYPALNHPKIQNHNVSILLDRHIPLIPFFVVPYLSFYFLIFITILDASTDFTSFKKVGAAFIVCLIISYTFFYFFQTVVYRPKIIDKDIFSILLNLVYKIDNPYNNLPSLHTSLSSICLFYWLFIRKHFKIIFSIWIFSIILSALLIKQHYILDIIFGLILGIASSLLFRNPSS